MKVILVEPGRNAQIVEIGNNLKDMQKAVGGYIEAICPFDDDVALVCNEEGMFNGSVKNRVLWYKDLHPELYNPYNAEIFDVIYGSFYAVAYSGLITLWMLSIYFARGSMYVLNTDSFSSNGDSFTTISLVMSPFSHT